jgi:hypothetical protein
MLYPSYSNKKIIKIIVRCFGGFCFHFDLLFVSSLWTYGVGMGPDLFVDFSPKKALIGWLA